jgi:hypothetical protein
MNIVKDKQTDTFHETTASKLVQAQGVNFTVTSGNADIYNPTNDMIGMPDFPLCLLSKYNWSSEGFKEGMNFAVTSGNADKYNLTNHLIMMLDCPLCLLSKYNWSSEGFKEINNPTLTPPAYGTVVS